MIALPQYIDKDAWQGFEEMRKTIKKPLTERARKLIVYELQRIKDAGHDANAALDQSTVNCWKDVWQPKEKAIESAASTAHERTQQYIAEHSRTPDPQAREHLKAIRAKLRAV